MKRRLLWAVSGQRTSERVFTDVYAKNQWGGERGSFYSGPGSEGLAARTYANGIWVFVASQRIGSIVDLGCGDFRVASQFLDNAVEYTGVDVVERLVALNQARYGSERVRFLSADIVTMDPLPPGELCLLREVLQHLSNAEILRILPKLARYRHVIYTDCQPAATRYCVPNRDISHGRDTRIWLDSALMLDMPPFNVPMKLLFDAPAGHTVCYPGERIRSYLLWPDSHTTGWAVSPKLD